ncbi:MAG: NAD(P)H-binding protein [Spirochaetales bacterium]|nr:NAD(P)H-binding protein [Spirochaetales bacterium]
MKVLVLGASGATGSQVLLQLIKRKVETRIIVRDGANISDEILKNDLVEVVRGNVSELNEQEYCDLVKECDSVVCCLGHNITFKGIFGKPRLLVYNSLRNVCEAIMSTTEKRFKVVLMNTVACENIEIKEKRLFAERAVLWLLKGLIPPQLDNLKAATYLQKEICRNNEKIEWSAVRPDSLIDSSEVMPYEVYESITRSPLFNPGKTSRINVAFFMVELLMSDELWTQWKGRMPVIYNREE